MLSVVYLFSKNDQGTQPNNELLYSNKLQKQLLLNKAEKQKHMDQNAYSICFLACASNHCLSCISLILKLPQTNTQHLHACF